MSFLKALTSALAAGLLSGCIASTYVSAIGMRSQHAEVVETGGGGNELNIYESKMEPAGGPCSSFVPYVSLVRSKKSNLIERREFNASTSFQNREYRKWYGYPAQSLQVIALPADIAIDGVILVGGIVAMPVFYLKEAVSGKEPKASARIEAPIGQ